MKVDFYRHALGAADAAEIASVMETHCLTTGPVVRSVEKQLCDYFAVEHALLVNSWTNGAIATLLALDVGPGDEVIVPAMTFIATSNVVELVGATPVFADVDPRTMLLATDATINAVTDRTKVVIPVHLYGQMCDIRGMRAALNGAARASRRIAILEDAAHCFEGRRSGDRPGAFSDAAIFSFYATKNVTCGEGGAVITSSADLHAKLLQTRSHGMSAIAIDRFSAGRYNAWDMMRLGTKANLPDLLAALLPHQIDTIDERLPVRLALAARYREQLAGLPIRMLEQIQDCISAEHLFPIGIPGGAGKRDAAIAALNEASIGVTVNYRDVPNTTYYRQRYPEIADRFPVSKSWGDATLTLPLFPGLTREEQDYVIDTVKTKVVPRIASPV